MFTDARHSHHHDDLRSDAAGSGTRADGLHPALATVDRGRRKSTPDGQLANPPRPSANAHHWRTTAHIGRAACEPTSIVRERASSACNQGPDRRPSDGFPALTTVDRSGWKELIPTPPQAPLSRGMKHNEGETRFTTWAGVTAPRPT